MPKEETKASKISSETSKPSNKTWKTLKPTSDKTTSSPDTNSEKSSPSSYGEIKQSNKKKKLDNSLLSKMIRTLLLDCSLE